MPLTIPEAIRGAEVEVPTLRTQDAARAGRDQARTVQRLRGEGPPKLEGSRPVATSTTAS